MRKQDFDIAGRHCVAYSNGINGSYDWLLVQPADATDMRLMDNEVSIIERSAHTSFTLVVVKIDKWNDALSPWPAPAVFGKRPFGGCAKDTLHFIERELLPRCQSRKVALGGYSLAGLFSLWAAYLCGHLNAVVAASPSVWYPGWIDYAESHTPLVSRAYLSLGDKESHTRTPIMRQVADCIVKQHELLRLCPNVTATLVWNVGNHFQNSDKRTADGFLWAMGADGKAT